MPLPPDRKAIGLWLLAVALATLAWMLSRIPQPLQYHDFADRRHGGYRLRILPAGCELLYVV